MMLLTINVSNQDQKGINNNYSPKRQNTIARSNATQSFIRRCKKYMYSASSLYNSYPKHEQQNRESVVRSTDCPVSRFSTLIRSTADSYDE